MLLFLNNLSYKFHLVMRIYEWLRLVNSLVNELILKYLGSKLLVIANSFRAAIVDHHICKVLIFLWPKVVFIWVWSFAIIKQVLIFWLLWSSYKWQCILKYLLLDLLLNVRFFWFLRLNLLFLTLFIFNTLPNKV